MTRFILPFCALCLFALGCGVETKPNPDFVAGADGSVMDGGPDGEAGAGAGGESGGGAGGDTGGSGGTGGDSGGSGGTGGDSGGGAGGETGGAGGEGGSTGCSADTECADNVPQCNASGICGRCSSNAACEDRGEKTRCDGKPGSPTRGQCVACTSDTHCTDEDAPHCLAGKCVECNADLDCPASKPQCNAAGACEACDSSEACSDRTDGKLKCQTADGANNGQCVECLGHNDCDNPEPQCVENACTTCTENAACADREGIEHCNTREGLETSGQCVQCTGETEDAECGETSCNQALGVCTETEQESVTQCQPCVADSECTGNDDDSAKCVTHLFESADLGSFCFYADPAGGCADVNMLARPYSLSLDGLSIDGHEATFCLPFTSCKAIEDASNHVECGTDNALCGVTGVADGICLEDGPASGTCSYACTEAYQCVTGVSDDVLDVCAGPQGAKTCQPN